MAKSKHSKKPENIYSCLWDVRNNTPSAKLCANKAKDNTTLADKVKELFVYATNPHEVDVLAETYKKLSKQ